MLGKKVEVYWNKFGNGGIVGWCDGVIIAQEKNGIFWVKYRQVKDTEGTPYFLEKLLTGRAVKFRIIS